MNTNQGYAYDEAEASPYDHGTVAALFDTRDEAKYALDDLREAGFHKTWMGVTRARDADDASLSDTRTTSPTEHVVETSGGGFEASLARFFGDEGRESLYDALTKRGVPSSDALALDQRMHEGGAIVTVEADGRYDEVLRLLGIDRANVAADVRGLGAVTAERATSTAATPVSDTDAARTLELREERLAVDRESVSAGAATISKRVVSEDASLDVPVVHEELFISRRPIADGDRAASGSIENGETIRIPLMREKVVVDKRTVVREEVSIGKRSVTGTERVDATVRHEELVVDGGQAKGSQTAAPGRS